MKNSIIMLIFSAIFLAACARVYAKDGILPFVDEFNAMSGEERAKLLCEETPDSLQFGWEARRYVRTGQFDPSCPIDRYEGDLSNPDGSLTYGRLEYQIIYRLITPEGSIPRCYPHSVECHYVTRDGRYSERDVYEFNYYLGFNQRGQRNKVFVSQMLTAHIDSNASTTLDHCSMETGFSINTHDKQIDDRIDFCRAESGETIPVISSYRYGAVSSHTTVTLACDFSPISGPTTTTRVAIHTGHKRISLSQLPAGFFDWDSLFDFWLGAPREVRCER